MRVVVHHMEKKRNMEVPEKSKVIDIIRKANVNPETVIVKRGKDVLLEDETVRKNDRLELIRIISGG